jgi:hypothetical protein
MAKAPPQTQPAAETNGTITAEQLCAITGLTDRRHRQLATQGYFPPPIKGRYQVGKVLVGVIKHQRELLQKKNDKLQKEELAYKKARREMKEEELAEFRKKYISKDSIGPALRNISLHQRAALQLKLEQELGPSLAGLTTHEILNRIRTAVDEICAIFRDGTKDWLDAPAPGAPGQIVDASIICPGAKPAKSKPPEPVDPFAFIDPTD